MAHGVPSNLLKVLYAAYIVFEVLRAFMIFFFYFLDDQNICDTYNSSNKSVPV